MPSPQTYRNHARTVPDYTVVFLLLAAYLVWTVREMIREFSLATTLPVVLAVALIVMYFSIRRQVLTVQDRVIRLEMRLRMRDCLPSDLASRAADLDVKQLVALRFASDDELQPLVRDVVEGRLTAPKEIKQRISNWQGDHLRA